MRRVLCIISSLNAGGAETFLMKISRTLDPNEYQLDFVVSAENGCYTQEVLARGGNIYYVPMRTKDLFGAINGLRSIVKKQKYEVVLKLGDTPVGVVDLLAAKLGGAKRLAFRSCNALTDISWIQKIVFNFLRPALNIMADVKLAPSILAAEFTFGKKQVKKQVHLIHNAVDLSFFFFKHEGRKRVRAEFSLQDKLVVGHIGRFSKQKNHRFLLEVFREIKEKNANAVLLLAGTGLLEQEIRSYAETLGILSSVIFMGVRHDIPDVLSAMDVFVFPSFHEGMPNTVIEAQATGLPCVIADTITAEADITGLVKYLPLDYEPEAWAEVALTEANTKRQDMRQCFIERGYDMNIVAREFVQLIFDE